MEKAIEVIGLSKSYQGINVVDDISFGVERNGICGLVGRNGAGKSTLLRLIAGQEFKSSGHIHIMGEDPIENAVIMSKIAFIKESERYPENIIQKAGDVLRAAELLCKNWDSAFAERLVADFDLPLKKPVRKLSRGQVSALGAIVGLASHAPITIFDEPNVGMDPVARRKFYDHLIADYSEYPRTILLSTHMIDESADLLEHILVMSHGRIIVDSKTEDLRGTATAIEGLTTTVQGFVSDLEVLETQVIGNFSRSVVSNVNQTQRLAAPELGLILNPLSLKEIIISKTMTPQANEMEITT